MPLGEPCPTAVGELVQQPGHDSHRQRVGDFAVVRERLPSNAISLNVRRSDTGLIHQLVRVVLEKVAQPLR